MDTKNEEASTGSRDLKSSCGERNYRSGGKTTPTSSSPDGSSVYGRSMHKRKNSQLIKASKQNMTTDQCQASSTSVLRKLIFCCLLKQQTSDMDTKNDEEASTGSRDLKRSCGERNYRSAGKKTPTSSVPDESRVYGRDQDKEAVLGCLLNGETAISGRVSVVAIDGREGVGKTTLARLLYNDITVANAFDLRAWVFDDSEDFDVVRITRTILQNVTDACTCSDDFNLLQVKLRDELSGKRCLIVLDDVSDLDYERWFLLCQPFAGSEVKIVVTTRNNGVPPIMAAISTCHLELLSDDDCLSMLSDHVKEKSKFVTDPKLQAIMGKIARKCKGSPLAAKKIMGRLRSTDHYTDWEKI
ncbi:hypothetical protein OIU85_014669 [Salix viminalis]|uniref:NB-ARC domain-containing protein n=1 Tax=Salix viminalis TaxID=40686 RepID=A0A9Q0SBD5_SALVM|nr:hypothetical protein OIU85_014669 [Salix viminalis]